MYFLNIWDISETASHVGFVNSETSQTVIGADNRRNK